MIQQEAERSGVGLEEAAFPTARPVHPEDRKAEEPTLEKRLWSVLPLSVLSGLLGMTYGAAALSSALSFGTIMDVVSLVPLVTLATGWTAAMFCMCKEEATNS